MSDTDFKIKKGLNVANGRFIANDTEITIDGDSVVTESGTVDTLTTTAQTVPSAINELDAEIGVLSTLTTTDKSTLVASINELDVNIGDLSTLATTAKTSVVIAINELDVNIGDLSTLATTAKTSVVVAINEVDSDITSGLALKVNKSGDTMTGSLTMKDSILMGNDPLTDWGSVASTTLLSVNDNTASGETGQNHLIALANIDSPSWNEWCDFYIASSVGGSATLYFENHLTASGTGIFKVNLDATPKFEFINNTSPKGMVIQLNPIDGASAVVYDFDSAVNLTTEGAQLIKASNFGVEKFSIGYDGDINTVGQITGAEPWEIHTTTAGNEGITGVINRKYMVDTTSSTANITLTMPSASLGDVVTVTDMKNNFVPAGSKNVVTNSITFEGATTTFEFDVANSTIQLVYTGASYGWKAIITQP